MAKFILKDWYGKNCEFDHDKIFVQDANGNLVQFTQGKGNPTLETLEVTENGTYTPSEGVDGFNSVSVDVPIPEVVLQNKTITENGTFTADEGFDGFGSVTVDVKGGGGSLPAGGYWKGECSRKPYASKEGRIFVYKGKRYWFGMSAYNATKYDIYLYENEVYTLVAEGVATSSLRYTKVVEYKDKVHFVGNDDKTHYTWDGSSNVLERCADLPYGTVGCAFVIDDALYIKSKSGFYKWLESSDAWEAVEVANCPSTTYVDLAVIDRKIYISGQNKIYEVDWDTKTCVTLANISLTLSGTDHLVVLNGNLYLSMSDSYSSAFCGVYKYNLSKKTCEFLAGCHALVKLYIYNNRIYGSRADSFHASLYEVTE